MGMGRKRQYLRSSPSMRFSSRNSLQSSSMCSTMSVPRSVRSASVSVNSGEPSHVHFTALAPSLYERVMMSTLLATMKAL